MPTELELKAAKNQDPAHSAASEETARRNASAQTTGPDAKHPALASQAQKEAGAVVTPGAAKDAAFKPTPTPVTSRREKEIADAKQAQIDDDKRIAESKLPPNYGASTHELGGVTKILREAGDENTGKPSPTHVVQSGGGGATVDGATGQPAR
jgi:hypothetical protein